MVRAAVVSDDSQRAVVQQSRSDDSQRAAVVQQSCSSRAVVVRSRSSRAVVLNRVAVAQYRIVQSVAMSARGKPHPHLVKLSKFLVYVCRHGALDWGLRADPDGWLDIDDVLSLKPYRVLERGHVHQIVEDAADGRLEIDSSGSRIRARQGHSLAIRDDSFRRVEFHDQVPRWLIHGTDEEAFLKIRREGIAPMTRQHVHLETHVDVVHDYSTVHIYVDKSEVLRLGMELLISGPAARPLVVLLRHTSDDWVVAEEVETTTRWKQIRLGERTHEYSVWLYSSDKDKRLFPTKQPPDSSAAMPKRVFLRELSAWRRSLHEFQEWLGDDHERRHDPPAPRGTVASSSSSYRGRTSYPAAKRPRTSSWSETEGLARPQLQHQGRMGVSTNFVILNLDVYLFLWFL